MPKKTKMQKLHDQKKRINEKILKELQRLRKVAAKKKETEKKRKSKKR